MIYNPEQNAIQKAFDVFSQIFYDQFPYHIEKITLTISSKIEHTSYTTAILGAASFYYGELDGGRSDGKLNRAKIIVYPLVGFTYPHVSWYHIMGHEFGHLATVLNVNNYVKYVAISYLEMEKAADDWMFEKLKLIGIES